MEVVAVALGGRTVDHTDRSLELGVTQGLRGITIAAAQEKTGDVGLMEGRLVAAGGRRADALALRRRVPVGRGCYRTVVGAEAHLPCVAAMALAHELTDIEFATVSHFGGARVAQMRVMRPDDHLRASLVASFEVRDK